MTETQAKKSMFCFNPADPIPMEISGAAFEVAIHNDAEISPHDLGLYSMASACSMLTFFGYQPKDVALIAEKMAAGYLHAAGPSGNQATIQDITTLTEDDL
jgi:hypothetical protein